MILKGALAAGAVYGIRWSAHSSARRWRCRNRRRRRNPQLRPHPRVPRVDLLQGSEEPRQGEWRTEEPVDLIASDEQQHVEALTATIKQLGGKPVAEPKFNFDYNDTAGFLKLAQTFEDTGVSAYNGAGADDQVERSARPPPAAIVQVEARHAAAIRLQNTEEPAPAAFDRPLDEAQVLKAVEPFIA